MKVTNPLGLVFAFSTTGAVRSIEVDPVRIGLAPPSPFSTYAGANLYLRVRGGPATPLLGAGAPGGFRVADAFESRGSWSGIDYECTLQLAPTSHAWQWRVHVTSRLPEAVELDLVYVQDVGLKTLGAGLINEAYVSQYVERRLFTDPRYGRVVCCRQNAKEATGHPWLMLACPSGAAAASTDGSQFYGKTFRLRGEPEGLGHERLGGERAGESSIVALQAQPFVLAPGSSHASTFVGLYLPDHPEASSELDLQRLPDLVERFAAATPPPHGGVFAAPVATRFDDVPLLPVDDLSETDLTDLFGPERRHVEVREGRLLSFFAPGPRHVVLREKEAQVERPHGHIMQARAGWVPDERIMSTTAFACGVFSAHVTQGNTNFNTLLSVCTNPAMPPLDAGLRMVVEIEGTAHLLGVPSAFEMGLNHCRWIYAYGRHTLQVRTWSAPDAPRITVDFQVLRGAPVRLTLVHHFDALNGWTVAQGAAHEYIARPRAGSMIAERFPDARFRFVVDAPDATYAASEDEAPILGREGAAGFFVLEVAAARAFCLSILGEVTGACAAQPIRDVEAQWRADAAGAESAWRDLSRELTIRGGAEIQAIREILPWYGMNALVHFTTPYGLEQFSGAAWGTRDVCQGPIDLLLCEEKYAEAKEVLRTVFSRQDPDGGWPQWWMFDRYAAVRADSAHGDVVYWCILALCSYLKASGDFAFLDEALPYFSGDGAEPAEATPLREHVDRVLRLVTGSFVPGTALVRFGGGDWNDSLQPVSKDLAERLISSWTVQMCYQAVRAYGEVCARAGDGDGASALAHLAERILADFHRHLVKDGVVAGYGQVGADGKIDVLLHPGDATTGVRYSLLPMNRGVISGMFSKDEAEHHLALIERHLKGPDGARLMDRPLRYRGGPQTIFQRAESSTYFGREIGLMYVHEHLRYAEAQARMGRPEPLLAALRQAIPVDYQEVVPQGDLRQANCYYSSSDVVFASRYEADARYDDVIAGEVPLVGGWRVYSSGPGIFVALVVTRLLGLRTEYGALVLDPVLARSLDGLEATVRLRGHLITVSYHVDGPGFGPRAIAINGEAVAFAREDNPYRQGGAVVPLERFEALLRGDDDRVDVWL